jgi:hypothetical protein
MDELCYVCGIMSKMTRMGCNFDDSYDVFHGRIQKILLDTGCFYVQDDTNYVVLR